MTSFGKSSRSQAGFSLIEVLVTTVVVGTALVAASWSLAGAARHQALQRTPYAATLLAKEVHGLALTLPRTPSGQLAATSPGEVLALDSLLGATFNPPILADRSVDDSLSDWTQQVDLEVFDTSDLTTPSADDPADGIAPGAAKIYRLSVTLEQGGTAVATCRWWLTP